MGLVGWGLFFLFSFSSGLAAQILGPVQIFRVERRERELVGGKPTFSSSAVGSVIFGWFRLPYLQRSVGAVIEPSDWSDTIYLFLTLRNGFFCEAPTKKPLQS